MTHTCTKHEPGTAACYFSHACRCEGCRRAGISQQKRAKHVAQYGVRRLIPNGPVVERVRQLMGRGMSASEVATLAGVSGSVITRMLTGQTSTTTPRVAAAISSIPHSAAPWNSVPITGTVRRIRALSALGWTARDIGMAGGATSWKTISDVAARPYDSCAASTAEVVATAYRKLWDKKAPHSAQASRARNRAARKGWAPPAAWDDGYGPHGIDNPDATPVGVRGSERQSARSTDVLELAEVGTPAHEIAARLGLGIRSVERALQRAGRGDLWTACRPRSLDQRTERAA